VGAMESRARSALFALSLVLSLSPAAFAGGRKPPQLAFTLDPPAVTAGRTLAVACRADVPLRRPELAFNGRAAHFYPPEGGKEGKAREWTALLGVHSLEPAGVKVATFTAEWRGERVALATVSFAVVDGTYPVSRVTLSAQRDKLVASGQMERDAKTLEHFYQPAPAQEKLWSGYFIMPTTGVVSSLYGARRSYGRRTSLTAHSGLDIANAEGTPIVAPNRGRVVFAEWLDAFGHSVVLEHGRGVFSYYLHMKESFAKKDDLLSAGAPIGLMGAEGVATGPHLHWSFVVAGERVDPREWTEREFR
jgi:murein DD-endopeptidase MepM/ murein hydrolase activator NlpD